MKVVWIKIGKFGYFGIRDLGAFSKGLPPEDPETLTPSSSLS